MSLGRRFLVCCIGFALACLAPVWAQDAPKPGPEHARLGFWVGDWTNEGEIKENPFMPAGPTKGEDHCESKDRWKRGPLRLVHTRILTSVRRRRNLWEAGPVSSEWRVL